jgi:hypothetical protein
MKSDRARNVGPQPYSPRSLESVPRQSLMKAMNAIAMTMIRLRTTLWTSRRQFRSTTRRLR